ncbi:MAG: tripartite tricarboxylate transporter TctB family protein [Treponema sp.]|nr:tripartite tricarboxylate transporter TctB family protein [Treponema sp.]
MKNVKFIIGFSFLGFLLSVIFGVTSQGNYFGRVILHALIFAVVFAVLAVLIQFIFNRVLEFGADSMGDAGTAAVADGGASSSSHSVDIVVQDEDLPADENGSQFYVGMSRQMLSPEDTNPETKPVQKAEQDVPVQPAVAAPVEKSADASVSAGTSNASQMISASNAESAAAASGFVPISLGETPSNISSVESATHEDIKKVEKSVPVSVSSGTESGGEELDSLPDLEDLTGFTSSVSAPPSDDVDVEVEDSGYTESATERSVSAEEVTSGKDAELMAKAISTLLAKE